MMKVDETLEPISRLVEPERVHSSVYTDPSIFELELERIFYRSWVYIGHESQLPEPGDFVTGYIARQPILLIRDGGGIIRALFNKCPHRGSLVARADAGHVADFTCPYHGWCFGLDGSLLGVPYRNGYADDFFSSHDLRLEPVPRLDNYRGFLFASLAPEGPTLSAFLGPMTRVIDNLLDRSPTERIELASGCHRYEYAANWKFQLENVVDGYHPPFTHASTLEKGTQFQRSHAASGYRMQLPGEKPTERGLSQLDSATAYGFDYGHSYLTNPMGDRRAGPDIEEYRTALRARLGERYQQVVDYAPLNAAFYPNLVLRVTDNEHVRVLRPIAVDRTEVMVWPIHLIGSPRALTRGIVRHSNIHTSATSVIQTDDLEVFARCQEGMQAQRPEWVYLAKGFGQEQTGPASGEKSGPGTWETPFRAQFRYWRELMAD
jgi:benzoate/toluate 1,2-dioxygenase subunit alpha